MSLLKEISIFDFENLYFGNFEDKKNATGVTVITSNKAFSCGVDIRGGGPASRETHLLNPLSNADKINAVVLSGGSAFGLDCAGGVMKCLEEKNIGFDVGITKVPLVCTSCIFDLVVGSKDVRPDFDMGYKACENAFKNNFKEGNFGCGTGATVGKIKGPEFMMKSGIGAYAVSLGSIKVGAIVCTNALGDVFDPETQKNIAGVLNNDKTAISDSLNIMYKMTMPENLFSGNTTIGACFTNALFEKYELNKLASFASNGMVNTIRPINTTADGDSMYAISCGDLKADINVVGSIMQKVCAEAILRSVKKSNAEYNLKCANDFT